MTKTQFILELSEKLSGLPKEDVKKSIEFYVEMIDDRMDEGMSEADAISAIGSIDDIAEEILGEIPIVKLVKEKVKPKRKMRAWEIVLLSLGSPIWISLAAAAFAVIISVYVCLWAAEICIYAANITFFAGGVSGLGLTVVYFIQSNVGAALLVLGAGILCVGIGLLMLGVCRKSTKGMISLTKKICLGIKKMLVRKETK